MSLNGFQHSTHPFLLLCIPLGNAGKKVSCCSLDRNKNENKTTSVELVYTKKKMTSFNHKFYKVLAEFLLKKQTHKLSEMAVGLVCQAPEEVWSVRRSLRTNSVSCT